MRYMGMLFVMTAMVVMAAGSTRGNTSPGPPTLGAWAVASELSSLPAVKSDDSSSQGIFATVQNSAVDRLLASAVPDHDKNGCDQGGHHLSFDGKPKPCPPPPPPPPPPQSKKCPCDSHGNPIDPNCGKGNDSNNP